MTSMVYHSTSDWISYGLSISSMEYREDNNRYMPGLLWCQLGANIIFIVYGWSNTSYSYIIYTVYPKKYAHGFCFAVLCCGYTLTDFPISIRLTSLALWQSNDCPSASKATLMNMDKYLMWIHYERLHNRNKAKHNKTVCIFLGIYCNSYIICMEIHWHCTNQSWKY